MSATFDSYRGRRFQRFYEFQCNPNPAEIWMNHKFRDFGTMGLVERCVAVEM